MFVKAILALSLASLSLAAPASEPRQPGGIITGDGGNPPGGGSTSCSSLRPIEYELDHTQHRSPQRYSARRCTSRWRQRELNMVRLLPVI